MALSSPDERATDTLRRLCEEAATGELVCATEHAEVHVHLQEGRIAWATSSAARFAFTRYLREQCDIDTEVIRALLLECQRERKPLGETLVDWGIATAEQVRAGLSTQIVEALDALRADEHAQCVFLQKGRGYHRYSQAFTFPLGAVFPKRRRPHRASQRMPALSSRPPAPSLNAVLADLVADELDVRWVELHREGRVELRLPDGEPIGLHEFEQLLGAGADFIAVRGGPNNLIGVYVTSAQRSVWCGVDPDVVLNAMISTLRERLQRPSIARASIPGASMGEVRVLADRGLPPQFLRELMARSPAVWGVGIVSADGAAHCLAHREAIDAGPIQDRFGAHSVFLRAVRGLEFQSRDPISSERASVVTASAAGWIFGAELLDDTGRDVWLLVDPSAGLGIGWGLLAALLRRTSLTWRELRG